MAERTALVVCPGRGTYTARELGYLRRYGRPFAELLERFEAQRRARGRLPLRELDGAARFSPQRHTAPENAAALITACSWVDFLALDRERFEVVALCGNSMGWYTALGLAGALSAEHAFALVEEMAQRTQLAGTGQLVYPEVDAEWRPDPARRAALERALDQVNALEGCAVYDSIFFGGYRVLGGNEAGLSALEARLPRVEDRFPLRLAQHAAFHTPLMAEVAARARAEVDLPFGRPALALIDGRGAIWQPYSTVPEALRAYTLGHQLVRPFDFSRALEVGLKEFAPEAVILLGPGTGLGGAVGQVLGRLGWHGIRNKGDFQRLQATDPFVLALGREDQRARAVRRPGA